ncbi:MAG: amidohydrolase family protein, partial [Acidobacteriota bacterium]
MKRVLLLALFTLATTSSMLAQARYDLLIRGGHVIDPKNSIDGPSDVAVKDGKIAAVEKTIDPALASRVVDAKGLYVTPGLVDMHVHLYTGTGLKTLTGDQSVYPDGFSFRA